MSTLNPKETAWAIYQHRAAYAVLQELHATGESIADLAGRLDEDPAWLTRKLHGQTPADLGDITGWALALGVNMLPVFDESAELRT